MERSVGRFPYLLFVDELIDFDADVNELEQVIRNTSEETQQKVDWTTLWAEKYPVLASYKQEVKTEEYRLQLSKLLHILLFLQVFAGFYTDANHSVDKFLLLIGPFPCPENIFSVLHKEKFSLFRESPARLCSPAALPHLTFYFVLFGAINRS